MKVSSFKSCSQHLKLNPKDTPGSFPPKAPVVHSNPDPPIGLVNVIPGALFGPGVNCKLEVEYGWCMGTALACVAMLP